MSDMESLGYDIASTDLTDADSTLALPPSLEGFDTAAVVLLANSLPLSTERKLIGHPLGPSSWEATPDARQVLIDLGDEIDRHITVIAPPDDMSDESLTVIRGLKMGQEPDPDSLNTLASELLVRRPILRVSRSGIEHPDPRTEFASVWASFVDRVHPLLRSIGLIGTVHRVGERTAHVPHGTAWLVDDELVVTNFHVVDSMTKHGWGTAPVDTVAATVTFSVLPTSSGPSVMCRQVVATDEDADLATLAVEGAEGAEPLPPPVSLKSSEDVEPAAISGLDIAVVGYPLPDKNRNPLLGELILGIEGGFQAAAPGVVTRVEKGTIRHNCSTTGGNSGSPVFDLATGSVVAIHRGGTYVLGSNLASPVAALRALLD